MQTYDLTNTYLHLDAGPAVTIIQVTDDFWQTIDQRADLATGRLVMASIVTADWTSWEMHPNGDEIIQVHEGAVRIHVDTEAEPTVVRAPDLVVMPAGTWHTMDAIEPARVVTTTWGAGTRHRPR